ncbi:MDR family MFS transporter [Brevibacillus brevis]|uniref:MDR family MFS transporter n=1 Tax=Brevibacillus brevis TaxID=1393 RepID=UPI0025A5DEFE|nr:MFS transporter [Brevibacillus brevis]WJQ81760.1 MFS transporter [Brevibacillus brevis]
MSFSQLHPNIRIRIVTSFLTRLVGNMIFPFMAIYFSAKLGPAITGLLLVLTVCAQILMGFYGGYLADRWGRKKVMVYGQWIQCCALFIMMAANSPWLDSAWLTFAMMLVQNASNGMINPAADAMLIDVSTKENRTYMYGINYWSNNLSIALGSVVGGLLFATHRFELLLVLTVVSFLTLVIIAFSIKESYQPKPMPFVGSRTGILRDMVASYKLVMTDRRFILFSLGGMLIFAPEFQTPNYIAVRLGQEFAPQSIGLFDWFTVELTGLKIFSLIQLENTLLVVFFSLAVTKLIERLKEAPALYISGLMYIAGYSLIMYSNSLIVILAAVLISTIGELIHAPIRQTYLAQIVKDDLRSSYMAVNGLVVPGARIMGAVGITLGAVLPSYLMALLIFSLGVAGVILTRSIVLQMDSKERLLPHTKEAAT